MSPEDTHKAIRIYIGGLILGVNTLYMLFCFFKLLAVAGNELIMRQHAKINVEFVCTSHGAYSVLCVANCVYVAEV